MQIALDNIENQAYTRVAGSEKKGLELLEKQGNVIKKGVDFNEIYTIKKKTREDFLEIKRAEAWFDSMDERGLTEDEVKHEIKRKIYYD